MTETCDGTNVDDTSCQNDAGFGTDDDSDYCYIHEDQAEDQADDGDTYTTDFREYATADGGDT